MLLSRGIIVLIAVFLVGSAAGVELSTLVLPSEDEAREALENGEITYRQYLLLSEIIIRGIDDASLHLLDEIPNLVYFRTGDRSLTEDLEGEQRSSIRDQTPATRRRSQTVSGQLNYRFYQQLDDDDRSWYRSNCDLSVVDRYRVRFQINREKSGRERIVSRSLGFTQTRNFLRRIILGNYTTRLGLGTLFGHAGKRFDYADALGGESWAYPDYGGYNGLLVDARASRLALSGLVSIQRDIGFRLLSAGMIAQWDNRSFSPGLLVGYNRLANRLTDRTLEIPMIGIYSEHRYSSGYLAFETGRQMGAQASAGSVVVEGRHRLESSEIRFAGWSYADDFIDLTAGSKSAYLTRSDTLCPAGLAVSARRPGQSGMLIKTVVALSDRTRLSNGILYAGRAGGYRRQQFSTSLSHTMANRTSLLVTYLGRLHRNPQAADHDKGDHRFRLEGRFLTDRLSLRCYIGYDAATDGRGHASLFGALRYNHPHGTRVQLWSNVGDVGSVGVRYWYLFAQVEWPVAERLTAAAKLANTYRREDSEKNRTRISLELKADL